MYLGATELFFRRLLRESINGRSYSSTQIAVSPQIRKLILSVGKQEIKSHELAEDGREKHPHITIKYGIHTNNPMIIRAILEREKPIKYKLGEMSLFKLKDHNVLIVKVISPDLKRLNAKIKRLTMTTDTHPIYKPHVTIAYVKKSFKLPRPSDFFEGMAGMANEIEFSSYDDKITRIKLGG